MLDITNSTYGLMINEFAIFSMIQTLISSFIIFCDFLKTFIE